jgi:glycosyltransferase involved in cell wall biosynthesis
MNSIALDNQSKNVQGASIREQDRSILLVSLNTFYGGGEIHVENLARLLGSACQRHALVFDPILARNLRAQGVHVYQLSRFPESARALQVFHGLVVLPRILLRHRIKIVQVTGSIEAILLIAARLFGCNTTISIRHLVPFLGDGTWLEKLRRLAIESVYSVAILAATRVVCVSEAVAAGMRRHSSSGRIVVIPNWVPVMPTGNLRAGRKAPLRLLYVGRLERHKGLHLLLEALQGLSGYELKVVGDGSDRRHLESLAEGLNVRFLGFQSNVADYYRDADIFVMPSLGPEGLPLVTIEAMSHALPCIVSDLPVHKELSNGDAAMLFACGDSADLRQRLQTLMSSAEERSAYGTAAYDKVLSRHSPEVARAAYLAAFGLPQSEPRGLESTAQAVRAYAGENRFESEAGV